MQRELIITAGPESGRVFTIDNGQTLVVGRGQRSDTQINDPRISRIHFHLQATADKTILIDNGSAAGTAVNDRTVRHCELQSGDLIQIGSTKLRLRMSGGLEQSTLTDRPFADEDRPVASATADDLLGQMLADYRIEEVHARGQSGIVFRATHTTTQKQAAVKVLTPAMGMDSAQRERFVRAMKTMINVRDKHLVPLLHAGQTGPYCWAAMEFVEGESLDHVIRRVGIEGMLDWRYVWRMAFQISLALHAAERNKLIHRNLTPRNIICRANDATFLLGDLMLAKATEGTLSQPVTQPGQLVGDLAYMAPERTRDDDDVDTRADIYGLGATCYALLTGTPPFDAASIPEMLRLIREQPPTPPRTYQLSINGLFEDCVMKMLAKDPANRHENARALFKDLDRIGRYASLDVDVLL